LDEFRSGERLSEFARDVAAKSDGAQRQPGAPLPKSPRSSTKAPGASTRSAPSSVPKEVAPNMIERGYGVMLFTGATAGVKAGPRSVAFGGQVCDTLARPSARAGSGAARHSRRFGQHRRRHRYTAVPERFPQFKDDDLLKPESPRPTGIPRIRTAVPGRWN
jgi:hypothetical protein